MKGEDAALERAVRGDVGARAAVGDGERRETRRLRVGFSRLTARRRARAILSNARAGTITVGKISRARVNISPRVR